MKRGTLWTSFLIVLLLATYYRSGSDSVLVRSNDAPVHRLVLDPLTLNLKDGHYVVMSMDLTIATIPAAGEGRPNDTVHLHSARALDLAIAELGTRASHDLDTVSERAAARADLTAAIVAAYGTQVIDVGFNEFLVH